MRKTINSKFLYSKSKDLLKTFLVKYSIVAIVALMVEVLIISLMLLSTKAIGQKVGIAFIALDGIAAATYLLIIDLEPARQLRKSKPKLKNYKMTNEQKIVFYNFLKYRTVFRLIINLAIIGFIIILTFVLYV